MSPEADLAAFLCDLKLRENLVEALARSCYEADDGRNWEKTYGRIRDGYVRRAEAAVAQAIRSRTEAENA